MSNGEHIWVIIEIAWVSSVARAIPKSIKYLPKCFSMKLERKWLGSMPFILNAKQGITVTFGSEASSKFLWQDVCLLVQVGNRQEVGSSRSVVVEELQNVQWQGQFKIVFPTQTVCFWPLMPLLTCWVKSSKLLNFSVSQFRFWNDDNHTYFIRLSRGKTRG